MFAPGYALVELTAVRDVLALIIVNGVFAVVGVLGLVTMGYLTPARAAWRPALAAVGPSMLSARRSSFRAAIVCLVIGMPVTLLTVLVSPRCGATCCGSTAGPADGARPGRWAGGRPQLDGEEEDRITAIGLRVVSPRSGSTPSWGLGRWRGCRHVATTPVSGHCVG